jgi:uncharacterized repeat protein (TIGR02543 family)
MQDLYKTRGNVISWLIVVAVVITTLFSAPPTQASAADTTPISEFEYKIDFSYDSDTTVATIYGYIGTSTDVKVPYSIDGYPVTDVSISNSNRDRVDLTSLDVSLCTDLTRLDCSHNQLTSLDISNNTKLKDLECYFNQLTSLDISNNTKLTHLDCRYNNMSDESAIVGLNKSQLEAFEFDPQNQVYISFDCGKGFEYKMKSKSSPGVTFTAYETIDPIEGFYVNYNHEIGTLPTAKRTGYTLKGFYTKESGGTKITPETIATADTTYYAHWTPNKYTVKFDANGGSNAPATRLVTYHEKLSAKPPTPKTNYWFVGWYTSKKGGEEVEYQMTKNTTYYAHYVKVINVKTHSKKEIKAFIKKHNAKLSSNVKYSSMPSFIKSKYKPGKLSKSTLIPALNMVNQMRYISGIDANVTLDSDYSKLSQAAALVSSINGYISHSPSQPKGMSDSLYKKAYIGAYFSNLSMNWNLSSTILQYMADDDSSNIDKVGHRRWILNPYMKQTGFGYAGGSSAMYAVDFNRESAYTGVSWPAKYTPIRYFGDNHPWSISLGVEVPNKGVTVKLIRKSDKKTWTFYNKSRKSGYFNINNGDYGQFGSTCIIFRPKNIQIKAGDKFEVRITGVPGTSLIKYDVEFFK